MRMRALQRLGYLVKGVDTIEPWMRASWALRQVQKRLGRGSIINEINKNVLETAREFRPNLIWAEKQEYLRIQTLEDLKRIGCKLVHFTPDPYFTLDWKRTSLMDQALSAFDVLVYCKAYERTAYEKLNRILIYMPLGYCDEIHRPLIGGPEWQCDIGFLGGWEPRRERMLRAIAATSARIKIRGVGWDFVNDGRWSLRRHLILRRLAGNEPFSIRFDSLLASAYQGGEIYADDYSRALTCARIGLGFLRTICPDQHTTRTFEIPACGSMLLADRTDEHQMFFEEGKHAEFFSSKAEMLDKANFYTAHEAARARVAAAGHQRCISGRYAYIHRMHDALKAMEKA